MRVFLASGGTLTPIGTCAPEPILSASHGIHPSPTQIRRVATTRLGFKTVTDSDVTTDPATIERAVVVGTLGEAEGLPDWTPTVSRDSRRDAFYDAMDALSRAVKPHDRTEATRAVQEAFLALHDRLRVLEAKQGTGAEP